MKSTLMILKVLLPYRVFTVTENVKRIVAETSEGMFGILPNRLDCVASLIPGIILYETQDEGEKYLAVDDGILIKAGQQVVVSLRNAIGGVDIGLLRQSVEKEFMNLEEKERSVRFAIAKLESGFIQSFQKLKK